MQTVVAHDPALAGVARRRACARRACGRRATADRGSRAPCSISTAQPLRLAGVAVDAFERARLLRAQARGRRLLRLRARRGGAPARRLLLRRAPTRAAASAARAPPPARGDLVLRRAQLATGAGRERRDARRRSTSPGDDDDWFAQGDGDRMDVAARAAALRARRDRALPGAHAVPRGDRARRRSSARASPRRFVAQLSGSDPVVEVPIARRATRRTSSSRCSPCAGARRRRRRPRLVDLAQARLPARHRRDPVGLARERARGARRARAAELPRARDGARARSRVRDAGRRARRRPAARSRSPRSTRACSSCCRTRAGSCSTR